MTELLNLEDPTGQQNWGKIGKIEPLLHPPPPSSSTALAIYLPCFPSFFSMPVLLELDITSVYKQRAHVKTSLGGPL